MQLNILPRFVLLIANVFECQQKAWLKVSVYLNSIESTVNPFSFLVHVLILICFQLLIFCWTLNHQRHGRRTIKQSHWLWFTDIAGINAYLRSIIYDRMCEALIFWWIICNDRVWEISNAINACLAFVVYHFVTVSIFLVISDSSTVNNY